MPTTTRQEVINYCDANSIELTTEQIDQAVDLVDNQSYTIPVAVEEAGHPELPTG